jgi:hypothetical protein
MLNQTPMQNSGLINSLSDYLLSEKFKIRIEVIVLQVAIISFIAHLALIFLVDQNIIVLSSHLKIFSHPISAIYTPFSFILIYEVYLLIYHLPKSTTVYVGKQYEIVTLIVIRKVFKDLSQLVITEDWFKVSSDVQFTMDLIATLVLFLFIFFYYRLNHRGAGSSLGESNLQTSASLETIRFIRHKKMIAGFLVPLFFGLATYSLGHWMYETFFTLSSTGVPAKDVNKIFFEEFFMVLIFVDVLLLLFSLYHTDDFNKIMRNSGFVISTILIKLSFGVEGIASTIVLVSAVAFGLAIVAIHNQFEKIKT